MISFYVYMQKYHDERYDDSIFGDLAHDMKCDRNFPRRYIDVKNLHKEERKILRYIIKHWKPYREMKKRMVLGFIFAWKEYKAYRDYMAIVKSLKMQRWTRGFPASKLKEDDLFFEMLDGLREQLIFSVREQKRLAKMLVKKGVNED